MLSPLPCHALFMLLPAVYLPMLPAPNTPPKQPLTYFQLHRLQLLNFKEKSPGSDQPPKPAATIPGAAQPPEPLTPQQQDAPASPATASGTNGTHGLPAAQQVG